MSIQNLDKIFNPRRIAVIGASDRPGSVGSTVMHNLIGAGFGGVVYPINPTRESVHGVQTYPNVAALPKQVDLAVVCIPAPMTPQIVRECGEAGIMGLIITSAGFREVGDSGRALENELNHSAKAFPGMRIIGPNCLGVIVPALNLNASFATGTPRAGHVAFVSQSGALCASILDWALSEKIGFSHFVSIGNALDVGFGDLIDYFAEDPATKSIILYVESITGVRKFMSAARAFARNKPIVAYKAGRHAESAKASASHTGEMASEDAVYQAAFERAGVIRVFRIDDIFDCAELLAKHRTPRGDRIVIVTNAGGPGVMASDPLLHRSGRLAKLSDQTIDALNQFLPPFWSRGNPVDVLGDAPPERMAQALEVVLKDKGVDAAMVILTPQAMTDSTGTAKLVGEIARSSVKPVLAVWMGGQAVQMGTQHLSEAGAPCYRTPEQAVSAFMHLVSYARNKEVLYETPRDIPVSFSLDRRRLKDLLDAVSLQGSDVLSETLSKTLLQAYDIPTTMPHAAETADHAVAVAGRLGYPVVLKVQSPDISHKTDVEGVELDLPNETAVRDAFQRIVSAARRHKPDSDIEGVTVQKMIVSPGAFELIVGIKKDPTFGAAMMVGAGGIAAEVFGDRALGLPPLNERLARRMLESLRSWPILQGYRGRPGADIDRLIEVLIRLSYLAADYPEIRALDINPLLVGPKQVIALDAQIIIDRELLARPTRPFAHLALRPYPEEYVQHASVAGQPVILRPIKPEDEPLWHRLLRDCSEETIRSRFRALVKHSTHEMGARFCFIDYDREMAIVSEVREDGERKLTGVGRLVADPNHEEAEFAILVADPWQGKGFGQLLVGYCLEVARRWGLKRVVAETDPDNHRMIQLFEKQGFEIKNRPEDDVVVAETCW